MVKTILQKLTHVAPLRMLRPLAVSLLLMPAALPVSAHPHVFVDGGVDFVFDEEHQISALHVTWIYDEFETLYILSSHGLSLNAEGQLDEADRQELIRLRQEWPIDFNGSAHLSVHGVQVPLDWPKDLDATLINGRLQISFKRDLKTPLDPQKAAAEVAFYESTYFFAFTITETPKLLGSVGTCDAEVVKHIPELQNNSLQASLALLSREETPAIPNVGAQFADRILLTCD